MSGDFWNADTHWFGSGSLEMCVVDGPFASPSWLTIGGDCLRRNRAGAIYSNLDLDTYLYPIPAAGFSGFSSVLEDQHVMIYSIFKLASKIQNRPNCEISWLIQLVSKIAWFQNFTD